MKFPIFCALLLVLSNFCVLLTFGEKPVSDTTLNENLQKNHENGNEDDISPNFSANMEIASESDEEQISSSDSVKHFDGFLLSYFKYLKVPGHCSGTCKGPKYNAVTNLDPIFAFINYIVKCDLTKNVCKNHQSSANGITWKVFSKTSKAEKIIVVFFKDQHGNLIQAQKWVKSKKIHVHIQNKEGLFIKLSGQSLDKGPTAASSFRLYIGDQTGNHVKEFESSKKRRVKYLDVDAGEDEENSYTIHLKNFQAKSKGRWCPKCNAKKFTQFSSSNSGKIGFKWVGFGPAGFGFGSPQPTKDCGCEKHEQGEELGLDFDLFNEDDGVFGFERHTYGSGSLSTSHSSSGAEGGFLKCSVAGGVEKAEITTRAVIDVDGTIQTDLVLVVVVDFTDLDSVALVTLVLIGVMEMREANGIIFMEVVMEAADIIPVAANLVAQKVVVILKL